MMAYPSLGLAVSSLAIIQILSVLPTNYATTSRVTTAFTPTKIYHDSLSRPFNNRIGKKNDRSTIYPSIQSPTSSTYRLMSPKVDEKQESSLSSAPNGLPLPSVTDHGIYDIKTKEEHIALLNAHPDKIVVVKFYAPWCRACKGLEPKFVQVSKDKKYDNLPLVFGQMTIMNNKDYIKSLGVLALPSIHIYSGAEGLVENFPCGPSKVPILKKKIASIVNSKVDPNTRELKPFCDDSTDDNAVEQAEPCIERPISGTGKETQVSVGDVVVSEETLRFLREGIPFFADFTDEEFQSLMSKSKYATFEPGSVIMKEGKMGKSFYVIDSGEVEISVKGAFEDPLTTPSGYLGAVINRLSKNDYFGERSLLTGQPRAASIRAVEKTRCFTFKKDDIPASSVLSGKQSATKQRIEQVNDKYGVGYYDINLISKQFDDANIANQARGSVNKPKKIRGVDTDEDVEEFEEKAADSPVGFANQLSEDRISTFNESVLSLLVRFKLLRHAARCFEYITTTNPQWGDEGQSYRRSLLVSKLSLAQRQEFIEVFRLIDISKDGKISLLELKRALEASEVNSYTDEEIMDMINKADPTVDGNTEMSFDDFMGVMAEAEFYYLFKDTFAALDPHNSGYVQAGKLDRVLCGLRDLISSDQKSLIDVEDSDMLVDYETFSRMMIGTA